MSARMPGPLSRTRITQRPASASASMRSVRTGAVAIASIALPIRLTSTCSSRVSSASAARPAGCTETSSSTALSRRRCATRNCALAIARCSATGSSAGLALWAKDLSWPVSLPSRSTMRPMRCRLACTSAVRCCSSSTQALSDSVRMAPSGWFISCTRPADIWPSAAILPACTSSSCAARKAAVRSTTLASRPSCAACSAAWLASFWRSARWRCSASVAISSSTALASAAVTAMLRAPARTGARSSSTIRRQPTGASVRCVRR